VSTKAQRSWYARRLATEEKSDSRNSHARVRDRVLYSFEFTRLVKALAEQKSDRVREIGCDTIGDQQRQPPVRDQRAALLAA